MFGSGGGLEVGSVFTRVGFTFDDREGRRFERERSKLRQESRQDIVQHAKVDVDSRGLQQYDRSLAHVDDRHRDFVRGSGRVKTALGSLFIGGAGVAAGSAAFYGLAKGVGAVTDAFEESQQIGRITNQVIKTTGGEANVSAKHVGALSTALSKKSGIDDEAIQSGENLLLTFTNIRNETGKHNKIFDQATRAALDMSKALGTDMHGAAIQVGKALNDPIKGITALGRAGVSFSDDQKKAIKSMVDSGDRLGAQKIILGELRKEFGGTAAATATNTGRMRVSLGNLAETLGGKINPLIEKAAGWITKMVDATSAGKGPIAAFGDFAGKAWRNVSRGIGDVVDWIKGAGRTIRSVIEDNRPTLESIGSSMRDIARTVGRVMTGIKDAIAGTFGPRSGTGRDIRAIIAQLLKVIDIFYKVEDAVAKRALPGIIQAVQGLARIIRGVIRVISGILTGDFGKAWDGVKDIFSGAVKAIGGIIRAGTAPLRAAAAAIGRAVGGAFSSAWGGIERTAAGFVNGIIDILNKIPGVHIGHVSWGSRGDPSQVVGPGATQRAQTYASGGIFGATGGHITAPGAIFGEEAPDHPEWVVPTNPAYRGRAIALWAAAARDLGIPGFNVGGAFGKVLGGVGSVGREVVDAATFLPRKAIGLAGDLIGDLPHPPGGLLGGAFKYVLGKAKDYIIDKAKSVLPDFGGGGGGGHAITSATLRKAADVARFAGLSIGSTYRDPGHNAAVGGVPNSLHTHGSPSNPGATDLNGPVGSLYKGLSYAVSKYHPKEALVHDVGSGLHLHLGWFAKGGRNAKKRTPRPVLSKSENRGLRRALARGDRGVAHFDQRIADLERTYQQRDRDFGLSDEVVLVEHDDGSVTIDNDALNARVKELDRLIGIRKRIRETIERYRDAVAKMIAQYQQAIARLREALKAAKGDSRQKERAGYRAAIADYSDRVGELRGVAHDLGFDLEDNRMDLKELRQERATVKGSKATPATDTGSSADTSDAAGGDGSGDAGSAGATPAEIAEAAAAQLAAFQQSRQDLFASFGSNFAAAGTNPFGTALGQAAGYGYFGAGGTTPGAIGGIGLSSGLFADHRGSGEGPRLQVINHYKQQPTDPMTWTRDLQHELSAVV